MLEINELHINFKIVILFFFVISFVYIFWLSEKKYLKNESIFDIAIGSLLGGSIGARLLGMIVSSIDYAQKIWSLLPVADVEGTVRYFDTMPWIFFDIFDKQISFIGLFLGIAITLIIIYRKGQRSRSIHMIYDSVFLSIIISLLIFLVASIFGQFDYGVADESLKWGIVYLNDGVLRFPIQIYQGGIIGILGLIYLLVRRYIKKPGVWAGVFLSVVGASEFYIHYKSVFYEPIYFNELDLYQIVSSIVFLAGLYMIFSALSINFFANKKKVLTQDVRPRSIEGNTSRLEIARRASSKNMVSFSQSFADRQNSIMDNLRDQENE